MKLVVYNMENCKPSANKKARQARIRVNRRWNMIYFNGAAMEAASLQVGDFVEFCHDGERILSWYVRRADENTGFKIQLAGTAGSGGKVQNRKLVETIMESYSPASQVVQFPLSNQALEVDGHELFCIVNKPINEK